MDAISKRDRFLPGNRAGDDFCAERYAKEFFGGGRGMAGACLCIDVGGGSIKYARLDESRTLMDYGVLDQFTRPIARMIMNLQFVYDPERFAIGGGISRQPKLLESIRRNLKQFYAWYPAKAPQAQVTVCRFFNEANLMGAYRNYVRTFGGFEGKKTDL